MLVGGFSPTHLKKQKKNVKLDHCPRNRGENSWVTTTNRWKKTTSTWFLFQNRSKAHLLLPKSSQELIYVTEDRYGCFRKWCYPQMIHFNRFFSIINHPFWDTPIFGNIHMVLRFFSKMAIFRVGVDTKQKPTVTCWMEKNTNDPFNQKQTKHLILSHTIPVWYIYLHLVVFNGKIWEM